MTRQCHRCEQPHNYHRRLCRQCHTKYCRERRAIIREQRQITFFQNIAFWTASSVEATHQ